MFDLIVKNATLPDGQTGVDIACKGGKIVAVEVGITAEAAEVIDKDIAMVMSDQEGARHAGYVKR